MSLSEWFVLDELLCQKSKIDRNLGETNERLEKEKKKKSIIIEIIHVK